VVTSPYAFLSTPPFITKQLNSVIPFLFFFFALPLQLQNFSGFAAHLVLTFRRLFQSLPDTFESSFEPLSSSFFLPPANPPPPLNPTCCTHFQHLCFFLPNLVQLEKVQLTSFRFVPVMPQTVTLYFYFC